MLHSIRCPFFSPHGQKHAVSHFNEGQEYDETRRKRSVFALEKDEENLIVAELGNILPSKQSTRQNVPTTLAPGGR